MSVTPILLLFSYSSWAWGWYQPQMYVLVW